MCQEGSNPKPEANIITGVPTETVEKRENLYLISNNYCDNNGATIKVVTDTGASSQPQSENANCENRNVVVETQYPQVIITHIPAHQQNPDEEEN